MTSSSPAVKGKNTMKQAQPSVTQPPPSRDVAWMEIRALEHSQFFTTTCDPLVFMDAVKTDFLQYLTMQRQQQLAQIRQAIVDEHQAASERVGDAQTNILEKLSANEAMCMNDTQWLANAEEYEWDLFDPHTRECIGLLPQKPQADQSLVVKSLVRGGSTYELFVRESPNSEFHALPLSTCT